MTSAASPPPRGPRPGPPPATYRRLSAADAEVLLRRILDRCSSRSPLGPPVLVVDLDGTLMDNRPRSAQIMRDLAVEWWEKHPEAAKALGTATPAGLAYLFSDSLRRLHIFEPSLVAEATAYWRARFFADDDLRHDVPVAGALSFVQACHARGATIAYLSGRDLPAMGRGTFASLHTLGFPLGVAGVETILKPGAQMADEGFKRMVAPSLSRIGEVVATFDNEPANCNLFLEFYPAADVVFVDTQHAPGAPPLDPAVSIIGDFTPALTVAPDVPPEGGEP